MGTLTIITEICKYFGLGFSILSIGLMIQAVLTLKQTAPVEIQDKSKLAKGFSNWAWATFISGCIFFGVAVGLNQSIGYGNWLVGGYTLWMVAANLSINSLKLKADDQKQFAKGQKTAAIIMAIISVCLILIYSAITALITLGSIK